MVQDDKYTLAAKAILDDFKKGKWGTSETIPAGTIIHQGIVGGNKDLTGITFIPSHATVEKYIGKPKISGPTTGIATDLEKTGFTIILPTDQTKNILTRNSSLSLAESVIDHKPYKVDNGDNGTYTVKKTSDNKFTVSGNYNTYNDNGKPITININPGEHVFDSFIGLNSVLQQYDGLFNEIDKRNRQHEANQKELNSRR